MPAYDTSLFQPPAPVVRVTLRSPVEQQEISDVPMLLDTGADVSLVPLEYATRLKLANDTSDQYEIAAFDGTTHFAAAVQVELIFLNKLFRGRFLLLDQEWGIIGRDILNLLSVTFDGPNLSWHEER